MQSCACVVTALCTLQTEVAVSDFSQTCFYQTSKHVTNTNLHSLFSLFLFSTQLQTSPPKTDTSPPQQTRLPHPKISLTPSLIPSTVVSTALPSSTQTCPQSIPAIPEPRPTCTLSNEANAANATSAYDDLDVCYFGQPIVECSGNCAAYCFAQEQMVRHLTDCVGRRGNTRGIFCSGKMSAMGNESTENQGGPSTGVGYRRWWFMGGSRRGRWCCY
ncbi:uncharacterized protein BDZ99DRAFT_479080 [Mytilinidion resinicola]|uniref:Uncharacterized protein n=1 Tax=Mytilinidion resinicola TaxID=574789 RepID=A0A6A6YCV9_9PEZI|nr:uncharacterized protein BDZ99DRAFT_479080 [Mytilinidion resinicola]KAF2806666.1 hypothetical protein BDZ99DRAFT_479080 [Mytilinidion resinicola]